MPRFVLCIFFSYSDSSSASDLFGGPAIDVEYAERGPVPEWDELHRLRQEKETLGLYLTGHPINRCLDELKMFTSSRIADLNLDKASQGRRGVEKQVVVAGLVIEIRIRNGRRDKMAFVRLDDRSGRIEVSFFGDEYDKYAELLSKDRILVVDGTLAFDDYSGEFRPSCKELYDIEQARARYSRCLELRMPRQRLAENEGIASLGQLLLPYHGGRCPVVIEFRNGKACAELRLDGSWGITTTDNCLQRLEGWAAEGNVLVRN